MELEYIKSHWINRQISDVSKNINAWDSVAEDYIYGGELSFDNDDFLKFMSQKIDITQDMSVLDVGCGAGAYSITLAGRAGQVVGVDFSPKMIAAAQSSAAREGIENVSFLQRDWYNCSGDEFKDRFDVAFAHTTPAVADYATLRKLMDASRKYCFLCIPARRSDQVLDELRELVGESGGGSDATVAFTFDTAWLLGCNPEVSYTKTVWCSERPLAEAETWYLGRLGGSLQLTAGAEAEIKAFLKEISQAGLVRETINTTLVNMFWEKTRQR